MLKWNDFVVRNVGDYILLVNVRNNEVFEIDKFTEDCIYSMQNNNSLDVINIAKMYGLSIEDVNKEWKEIADILLEGN